MATPSHSAAEFREVTDRIFGTTSCHLETGPASLRPIPVIQPAHARDRAAVAAEHPHLAV